MWRQRLSLNCDSPALSLPPSLFSPALLDPSPFSLPLFSPLSRHSKASCEGGARRRWLPQSTPAALHRLCSAALHILPPLPSRSPLAMTGRE